MGASRPIRLCLGVLLLAGCGVSWGAAPATGDTSVRPVSAQELTADVQRLNGLVDACRAQASGCDAAAVVQDERVGELDHGGYEMRWSWLRAALSKARDAQNDERHTLMTDAKDHLQEIAQQSGAATGTKDFARARTEADRVLHAPEFESAEGPTWFDRKKAQMLGWLSRFFSGVDQLGTMAPWIGKLLEWMLFLSAAVGLLIFLLRTLARQRLRVALDAAAPVITAWQRDATDWAQRAQQHADAAEWREAVHCLYWAAIVLLEGRRAWRHNPTRTPREYVRLLKPGSAQQQGLRGLTQIFERVWYGQREADRAAYQRAQASFQQLEAHAAAQSTPGVSAGSAGVNA